MNTETLIAMGIFVPLLWLHVIFYERIQRWRVPWSRWGFTAPPENVARVLKVLAICIAVLVSLIYAIMLVAAAVG